MDYERLDFGAKVPQFICDILKMTTNERKAKKKNPFKGWAVNGIHSTYNICVKRFPVEVALMDFALEYLRSTLEPSHHAFFPGFKLHLTFRNWRAKMLLITAHQYKKAYLTYQNVFIAKLCFFLLILFIFIGMTNP